MTRGLALSVALVISLAVVLGGCVRMIRVPLHAPRSPILVSAPTKTIGLNHIAASIPAGTDLGTVRAGGGCVGYARIRWNGFSAYDAVRFADRFDREVGAAGYRNVRILPAVQSSVSASSVIMDTRQLAESAEAKTDYLIAAVIRSAAWNICYPWAGIGSMDGSKGESSVEVNWTIYDRATQRIVAEITSGGYVSIRDMRDSDNALVFEAFTAAVRNLLANPAIPRLAE